MYYSVRYHSTAKPIDLLAKYISAEDDVDAIEMHEPYTYLNGLSIKDLEDLVEDIKVCKLLIEFLNIVIIFKINFIFT